MGYYTFRKQALERERGLPEKERMKVFFACLYVFNMLNHGAYAASAARRQAMSFGNIVADPAGDMIEINAKNGPTTPNVSGTGRSNVSGGFSGIVRVTTYMAGQVISIEYPGSIFLTADGAKNMLLSDIDQMSEDYAVSTGAEQIDFHIGGILHLNPGQQTQNYSGNIKIIINISNP